MSRSFRWLRNAFHIVVITAQLGALLGLPVGTAWADDPHAATIAANLKNFGQRLNDLGTLQQLGSALPLTALSPGAEAGLRLEHLLGEALNTLPITYLSLADLASAIDDLDGDYGGVAVDFSAVSVQTNPSDSDLIDVGFTVNATRAVTVPVALSGGAVALDNGALHLTLALASTQAFQFDTTEANPSTAFYLNGAPTLRVSADAAGAVNAFSAVAGFTDITATGSALLNLDIALNLIDPDGDGRITRNEWTFTAIEDLATAAFVDEPGEAVNATFSLDTPLIPNAPDGTLSLIDDNLTNGLNAPTFSLGSLGDFTNITPAQVLSGLGQLGSALLSAQGVADHPLPFLQEGLGSVFAFAEPLVQFLKQQGDAAIVCGTQNTDPPIGPLHNLPAGTNVYCQAIALQNPTAVTWSMSNGTVVSNTSGTPALSTVGTNPTLNAEFALTAAGQPQVSVNFTDPLTQTHTVFPRFQTAQEMFDKLTTLTGFDSTPGNLAYDPDTSSLTFRLKKTFVPAQPQSDGWLNFGDQIQEATHIIGLSPTTTTVTLNPHDIELDVTFGVILVNDINLVVPGGNVDDRFFLKVRSGAGEYEFKADVNVTATVALEGRLGFLEVEATGDGAANTANPGTAFRLARADNSQPMFAVDLLAPGIVITDTGTIPNAILLSHLLNPAILGNQIDPTCNMALSSGLRVSASVGDPATELASGGVAVNWPNVFDTDCAPITASLLVTPTADFNANLLRFDIDPTNPFALLDVILDHLDDLVTQVDALTGAELGDAFETNLPLLGLSPNDLLTQFHDVNTALDTLRSNPPESLQQLEVALEDALNIPASALDLELLDLPLPGSTTGDGVKDLALRLGYGICTNDNTIIPGCTTRDRTISKVAVPLNVNLDGLPSLVGLEMDSSFELEYAARAQLDLGFPLAETFDLAAITIIDTTGVQLAAGITTTALNLSANIGPLTLLLGTSVDTDPGPAVITGTATAQLSAAFAIAKAGVDGTPNNETFAIDDFVTDLDASIAGPGTADCGTVDQDGPGGADPIALTGDGCAKLSLGLDVAGNITYLGDLGFYAPDIENPANWETSHPADLADKIANAILDWSLLLSALKEALEEVEASLDGASADISLPLIGDALDAGAEVTNKINTHLITPLADLATQIQAQANVGAIRATVRDEIFTAIGANLLRDTNGDDTIDANDVTVTLLCGGAACADGETTLTNIDDIRITFVLGQGIGNGGIPVQGCNDDCDDGLEVPFDIGLPGLPIRSTGNVVVSAGWRVLTDFGLSRMEGPYVVASGAGHGADPEIMIGASASLGDNPVLSECNQDPLDPGDPAGLQGFSSTRCLTGTLGFLQVTLRDGGDDDGSTADPGDDRSRINLLTSLNLVATSGDRITFAALASGQVDLVPAFTANVNIDLRVRTGLRDDEDASFPSILGAFHMAWELASADPTELSFDNLHLDLGGFISDFIGPIVEDVRKVTSPLQPVIDTVRAPIPVLSDLAELVGEDPVTLLTLMEAASGSDLSLVERLIAFIDFANNLPTTGNVFIPLGPTALALDGTLVTTPGRFDVDKDRAKAGPSTPTQAGNLVKNAQNRGNILADVSSTADQPSGAFGVPGLSFPFLSDSLEIFGVLMGKDVTLVRYDAGTLRATASLHYTFGPIFVGPVPLSVTFSGSATLEGRFAIGYDTSGLRKVLSGASGEHLLDGIFIDDLDINGMDVPEISLIGTVSVAAGIDAVIVSAGVEGGLSFTVDLNLHDGPEVDGKLRIEEIANKLANPICLFDVAGRLEAFLALYVRVGFSFLSKTFRFELARVTLLEFEGTCSPPQPVLAETDGDTLILNMGSPARRTARGIAVDEIDEAYLVRQISAALPARFGVSAFGVYQEFCCYNKVRADADDGDDTLSFEPGASGPATATVPILFTAQVIVNGGPDSDKISSGDGNDQLNGNAGDDRINGGKGNDAINGGAGNDILNGEIGTDTLNGGDDPDILMGGPGGDTLNGDSGDDELFGGPGGDQTSLLLTPNTPAPNADLADTLTGGSGNDNLEGHDGDDFLYGDDVLACGAEGFTSAPVANDTAARPVPRAGPFLIYIPTIVNQYDPSQPPPTVGPAGHDTLGGGPGNDHLFGGGLNDTLAGDEGNDELCGNSGNDVLIGDDESAATPDGDDSLHGGSGDDDLRGIGGHDELFGDANNDRLSGGAENDDLTGGEGRDFLAGDTGHDILLGDFGTIAPHAAEAHTGTVASVVALITVSGGAAVGTIDCAAIGAGGGNADCLYGGSDNDFLFGEGGADQIFGEGGQDYVQGNDGADVIRGGQQDDILNGNADADTMFGDSGNDQMYGNVGNDVMRGGIGDDYMEGNEDSDTLMGDADQDDLIGGSSTAGVADTTDTLNGNGSQDVLAGDNAQITRPGGTNTYDGSVIRNVTLLDVDSGNAALSGGDFMFGDEHHDWLYGQGGNDQMRGGAGDDRMEGNAANDTLFGDAGQDDMLGGNGGAGHLDGDDVMHGGDGLADSPADYDVMAGDNALITRPLDGSGHWQINTFNAGVRRAVTLFDVAAVGAPAVSATVNGDDLLFGEGNDDVLYGQGGNDIMQGGNGDDTMEGNAEADTLNGGNGNDDMVGGTGRINDDGPAGVDGRYDAADLMHGDAGFDVLAGDNALLVRTLVNGQWQPNIFNGGLQHEPRILLDIDSPDTALVSGGDTMFGDGDDDLMYGQGQDDAMSGGSGDDFMEGNAASDTMHGDANEDDLIGGTVQADVGDAGDFLFGDAGDDVMAGDNASITRPLDNASHWRVDPNTTTEVRAITLYDVERVGVLFPVNPNSHGNDTMSGGAGRDLLFGQGNVDTDDDGDGRPDEDQPDNFDNDRDGRESADSTVYDCQDGADNDNDSLTDAADPDCAAKIDEDGGGDVLHGDAGDDYLEGNHGADWLFGDGEEDDLIGGSSAGDGVIGGGLPPTDLFDGFDVLNGGDDDDALLGDNGVSQRPTAPSTGLWLRLQGFGYDLVARLVLMDEIPEQAGAYGNDHLRGNAGNDDLYGQLGDDLLEGNTGEDALVGDLGQVINRVEDGSRQRHIEPHPPFIEDDIFVAGTMSRLTELFTYETGEGAEGNDTLLGGDGSDSLHGGPGDDIMNGDGEADVLDTVDEDHVFGDDGNDVVWGGRGHDHLWGGHGADYLDVVPRPAMDGHPADPPTWFTYSRPDHFQDIDYIYGGWDQDAMQADIADVGPVPGDRLMDWSGAYNVYYVCPANYGAYVITRNHSPSMVRFLQQLAEGDGALQTTNPNASGYREVGLVTNRDIRFNVNPPHPDHPGHFTCSDW